MAIGSNLPVAEPLPPEPAAPPAAPVSEAPAAEVAAPAEIPTTDQSSLSSEATASSGSAITASSTQLEAMGQNFAGKPEADKEKPKNSMIATTSAGDTRTERLDSPAKTAGSPTLTSRVRSSKAEAKDQGQKLREAREAPLSTASGVKLDGQGQVSGVGHASGQTFDFGKLGANGRVENVRLGTGETFKREGEGWSVQMPDGQSKPWGGNFATDKDGNVTVTQADGSSTRFAADGSTRQLDAAGKTTADHKVEAFADGSANVRDGEGRLALSGDSHGGSRALQYNDQGAVKSFEYRSKTDSLGMQLQADGSWKDSAGNSMRGAFSLGEKGDVTFKNEDGSSRTWARNGNYIERQGENVTSSRDGKGRQTLFEYGPDNQLSKVTTPEGTMELREGKWTGQAPPALLGKVAGKGPVSLEQLTDLKTQEDGSLLASYQSDRRLLQPDGQSVITDYKGKEAAAYNSQGQLSEVRSNDRTTTLGYDDQGKLDKVGYGGRNWERGTARDGHHRWHSQDGQGFTGEVKADSEQVTFQQFDPASGTSTVSSHNHSGDGGSLKTYDKNQKLSGETVYNADGSRQDRVFTDQGKQTNHFLRTAKDGQRSYGEFGKSQQHKVDPVSDELKAYSRTLDNNGNPRPPFDAETSAKSLYKALDGADDESAIFNELAGRSPEELKQIQDSFEERYHYSLRSDLKSDLSYSDEDRALAYLDGNHAKGDAIGLGNHLGDMKQVENLLQRQNSPDQVKAIEGAYQKYWGSSYKSDFNSRWAGYNHQIQANSALMGGDRTRAAAAKAAYSLRDGDAQGVNQALTRADEKPLSWESREAIREQYSRLTGGKSLAFDIDRHLLGNQNRQAMALSFGDTARAEAAVARAAMKGNESGGFYGMFEGWGTDEAALERGYERKSGESEGEWQARKQAVDSGYQEAYGSRRWDDVKSETSGSQLNRLTSLADDGKLAPAERIYHATVGAGTTEDELVSVLRNASTQEMKELRADYSSRYPGRNLDQDVLGDVSGRLHHDAGQWLRGMPDRQKDPSGHFGEQMRRLNETQQYERQGWQNGVGTAVTDTFSADGQRFDARQSQLQGLYEQARAANFQGQASQQFERELGRAKDDMEHYRDSKDGVTEGAATVVTTAAAVGAAVATWGAATPLVAAAAIGSGATSNLVTRAAMGGKEYTAGQAGKDATLGGLEGATTLILPGANKLAAPLLRGSLGTGMEKLTATATGRMLQRTAIGVFDGAAGGATTSAAYAAAEDRTWDQGLGQGFQSVLQAGMQGGTVGALTGGVVANVMPAVLSKGMEDGPPASRPLEALDEARPGFTRNTLGASGEASPRVVKGQEHLAQIDRGLKAMDEIAPGHRQKLDQLLSPEPSPELSARRQDLVDQQAEVYSEKNQKLLNLSEESVRCQYGQEGVKQRQELTQKVEQLTKDRLQIDQQIADLQQQNLGKAEMVADSFLKKLRADQAVARNPGELARFDEAAVTKMQELNAARQLKNAERKALGQPALPEITPESTRQWINDFYHQTGLPAPDKLQFRYTDSRAHYNPDGDYINIGADFDKRLLHHELAHRVEYLHPEVSQANKSWVEARSRNGGYDPENPARLKELRPNAKYRADEVAIEDHFNDPYVGRLYPDQATEVLSTGLEHFADSRRLVQLYQQDPEQFMLTLGGIRQAHQIARPDAAPVRLVAGPRPEAAPPEGIKLSRKADPDQTFQDYVGRPSTLSEKVFGRKLPAFVGTPYTPAEQARMAEQLNRSVGQYFGNSSLPKPDRGVTIPMKDLVFSQGGGPTVNSKTLEAYRKSGNFGQELVQIPTPDGPKYLVIEGHHRTSAAMLNGDTAIEPGRVYTLDDVAGLRMAGYDKQLLQQAVQNHTQHLWIIDR